MTVHRHHKPVLAYIGLGANLGDAPHTLGVAIEAIANTPGVRLLQSSCLYASTPVDAPGPGYTNSVIAIETTLDALTLLALIQKIEQQQGRERSFRNAPRTLDLDLLWFNNETIQLPQLTVPHPRAHLRAFVLMPWADIAPSDFVLTHAGQTLALKSWCDMITDQTCTKY
jgi:2-amino-4-hydroxy-6-hydroxymethyldihydropteridine diphosphokinase